MAAAATTSRPSSMRRQWHTWAGRPWTPLQETLRCCRGSPCSRCCSNTPAEVWGWALQQQCGLVVLVVSAGPVLHTIYGHNEHFEGSPLGLACELRVRHLPVLYAQRSSPCLRMHAAQHNCRFPLALRMLQLCNPSYVRCAGDLVTTLGALLRRLLDISARPASLAALFPPPPGWQEPPPYPLLLAAKPPEKAAGVEGPRPKSARGEGACMGTCGQLRHSVAQHTAFIAFP